jgi:hypothetical protein
MRVLSSGSHGQHTPHRDGERVGQWWKGLVVAAVTLPVAAYVVATLGAAPAEPTPPAPVVLRDPAGQSPAPQPRDDPDDPDDPDDDVSVVTPSPKRVGEDDGTDDARGSDDDDDTTDGGGDT